MDERLKRLVARREAAAKEREDILAKRKAIVDLAEEESREDLSEEEDTEFRELSEKIKGKDEELRGFDERITELSEEIERDAQVTAGEANLRRAMSRVQVVSESRTYEKGNGRSYLADLSRMQLFGDDEARARLQKHASEVGSDKEYRDLNRTDGTGGFFVPPAWLMSQWVELARASRATANLVFNQPLPPGTDSINLPKVSTGTSTAIQTADNAAVSETDLADTSVAAGVKTIAGQQDVAIQLLDQSPVNFDEVIFRDLLGDYATKLDTQVLAGSDASGQVKGIDNATGINAVTYTDTTPTVGELYSKIADAIQQVHTGRFMAPTVIVMHPRRWAWFTAALDTTDRPLVLPSGHNPQNAVGVLSAVASEQVVGNIQGLPVVTDPNITTTNGGGSDEDVIYVMRASDLYLYESGIRTRVLPEVGSGNLTVRLQVYGYLAFTAERYPKSVSRITGTGLTAPTF